MPSLRWQSLRSSVRAWTTAISSSCLLQLEEPAAPSSLSRVTWIAILILEPVEEQGLKRRRADAVDLEKMRFCMFIYHRNKLFALIYKKTKILKFKEFKALLASCNLNNCWSMHSPSSFLQISKKRNFYDLHAQFFNWKSRFMIMMNESLYMIDSQTSLLLPCYKSKHHIRVWLQSLFLRSVEGEISRYYFVSISCEVVLLTNVTGHAAHKAWGEVIGKETGTENKGDMTGIASAEREETCEAVALAGGVHKWSSGQSSDYADAPSEGAASRLLIALGPEGLAINNSLVLTWEAGVERDVLVLHFLSSIIVYNYYL